MKTQAAKVLASLVLITAFSSATLKAQLTVRSVGSVRHDAVTQVTVVFSAPVEQTSATTFGNYTFSAGITVTNASLMTGLPPANSIDIVQNPAPNGRVFDNECVVLAVTGLAPDATASVTIQNVQDRATPPNTIASTTINFKDSGYAWAESGTPALAGKVVAVGTNGFDIFSAGSGQWANYDEVVMVYKQVTGDFDVKARVEFQDFSSHWARAGVMARESLNEGENAATQQGSWPNDGTTPTMTPPVTGTASRYVDVHANPVQDFNDANATPILEPGFNAWESHVRDGSFLNNRFQGTTSQNDNGGAPPYPNAWVRIQRVGDDFHTFHGGDGVNWDLAHDRLADSFVDPATVDPANGVTGNPLPMKPTLFVGPAYGPETVNIVPIEGKNRLFLYQVRFNALDVPYLRLADPTASGVLLLVEDGATGVSVNSSSVRLTFDGNSVTSGSSKVGTTTTIAYKAASPFAAGTIHSITLTFTNTIGNAQSFQRSFTTPAYPTIPASYAVASASGPGFNVRAHQFDATRGPGDENSLVNAEEQAANGYIDPATGNPYPNTANLVGATGGIFAYNSVINWNNNGTAYGTLTVPLPADIGNWRDTNAAPYNIADTQFPGMPGSAAVNHNNAADAAYDSFIEEVTAYVQLKQGAYRMGVNSDDGFKVSVAPGTPDVFGLQLGVWNTVRGSTDSFFDFVVAADGIYPFRLLWWNGAGGANLEWFTVDLGTGEKILLNQPSNPNSLVVYQTAQGRASVRSILPADGYTGASTNSPIQVVLGNGSTTVVNGSITLTVDGVQVTPTIVNGATTTVTYNGAYKFFSKHTGTLVWGESTTPQTMHTNNFSFSVRQQTPDDLPSYTAGSFWIEAEDFDATGTPVPAEVNTMPYDIGANSPAILGPYDGIGATLNVDYFNNDNIDNPDTAGNTIYRSVGDPNTKGRSADVARDDGPLGDMRRRRPGGFDMTTNYKIGWGDSADWYNYTRNIPAGLYTALVALSNGDGSAPFGTPDRMGATLSIVTSGLGTTTQTLKQLGRFNGPSSGGWSVNNLVPLYAPDGSQGVFKITSPTTTLRFSLREGDYDWFVLVPVTGIPPKVTVASPLANTDTAAASAVPKDAKVRLTIEDFSTATVVNSVKLFFDGNDVTSTASIAKNADITTVTYAPILAGGSTHSYELRFTDNGTPAVTQTNKATFTVSAAIGTPGQFLIEAEDFDTGGGQTVALASTMPYLGGAYASTGAVLNVDYFDADARDSQPYRGGFPAGQNVNHDQQTDAGTLDVVRADGWTMTSNYKIGWTGAGDWFNYTRTFPANTYEVWAALSHDPSDGLRGSLSLVTSGVGTSNQTAVTLGKFNAPTSGGWGTDNLVQMKDNSGNALAVSLSGVQTVRFNADSGDYDYLLFAPSTATPSKWITSVGVAGGMVTIKWIGGGTLQSTPSLTPSITWTDLGTGGTFNEPAGPTAKFYRAR